MGLLHRTGWTALDPSQDIISCPQDRYLRGDNLTQDDQGVLSLRRGSTFLYHANGGEAFVDSLFTMIQNNILQRCSGIDDSVYINGARRGNGIDGDGDITFTAAKGLILWTRGETHSAYGADGVNTRNWGIAGPTAKLSLNVLDPHEIIIADCGDGEAWTATEGEVGGESGQDDSDAGSRRLAPKEESFRVTAHKDFGAPLNANSFGGVEGTDNDLVEFYYYANPSQFKRLTLMLDCDPDSKHPFEDDFFYMNVLQDGVIDTSREFSDVANDPRYTSFDRDQYESRRTPVPRFGPLARPDHPVDEDNSGWTKISLPRHRFGRSGTSKGKGWNTITAVRFTYEALPAAEGVSTDPIRVDSLRVIGGADRQCTGVFTACYRYIRTFTDFVGHSGVSANSSDVEIKASGLSVTIPLAALADMDPQVTEIEVFLIGGGLNVFTLAGTIPAGGPYTTELLSPRDAAIQGFTLDAPGVQAMEPPDGIVGAVKHQHYFRTLVLTSNTLHASMPNDPYAFNPGHAIKIADKGAHALWVVGEGGVVYVGTNEDIIRITGTWVELPDKTLDVDVQRLHVQYPPGSEAVAFDGNNLVYLSVDGLRAVAGNSSVPIYGAFELQYRGFDRYGVSHVNLGADPGRWRMAFSNGRLYVIPQEVDGARAVHVWYPQTQGWQRRVYPRAFRSIQGEPNSVLVAGDDQGNVWWLEAGTQDSSIVDPVNGDPLVRAQDDADILHLRTALDAPAAPVDIPVTLFFKRDFDGKPLNKKDAYDFRIRAIAGPGDATVALRKDGEVGAGIYTFPVALNTGIAQIDVSAVLSGFKDLQVRITGNFQFFRLWDFSLTYRDRPAPLLFWDSGYVDLESRDLSWIREVQLKARIPVQVLVYIYFDGVLKASYPVTPGAGFDMTTYPVEIARGIKGRQLRVAVGLPTPPASPIVAENSAFELDWVKVWFHGTGRATAKPMTLKQNAFQVGPA